MKVMKDDVKKKCPICNWEAENTYYLEGSMHEESACANCFVEFLVKNGMEILR